MRTYAKDIEYLAKRHFERADYLGQPAQDLEWLSPNIDKAGADVPNDDPDPRRGSPGPGLSRTGIKVVGVIPGGVSAGRTEQAVRGQGVNFDLEREGSPCPASVRWPNR
ncbi:MAG TPA: hypothetical protein VIU11_03105 [Nakamurella sp.]